MARLGAAIVGVDPVGEEHQDGIRPRAGVGLEIDYRVGTAEDLAVPASSST
jgi:hypothetical protein